jgi:hypothetical protein
VTTDDAACNGADLAVPGEVARNTTNDGAFDASFGLGGGRSKRDAQNGGTEDETFHGGFSGKRRVAATIRVAVIGSRKDATLARYRRTASTGTRAGTDNRSGICHMSRARNDGWRGLVEVVTDHSSDHLPEAAEAPVVHIDGERRDLRLDACRGLALWFIFLDHIPHNFFGWMTLRNYGFSDTTEVFVFVSGYTCMLAYGGALREQGWPTTTTRAMRRGWEIYVAFLLLLIVYLAAVWAVGGRYLDETNTAVFFENPGAAIIRAVAMQYKPVDTDVLPTFVLLHLAFPGLLWLLTRSAAVALAGSFLLYLLVQGFRWNLPEWPRGEWFFNPLAWQVLFVFGAWYGGEGASRLRKIVQSRAALVLATLYLAFGVAVALSWQIKPLEAFMPDVLAKLIYPIDKSDLAPLRLLHFLALTIVVSRLAPPDWQAPPDWHGLMKPWMMAMIRCGENSLAIYCLGVLLSFLSHVILVEFSGTLAMQVVVSIAGTAFMVAAANAMTWISRLDRHGPRPF